MGRLFGKTVNISWGSVCMSFEQHLTPGSNTEANHSQASPLLPKEIICKLSRFHLGSVGTPSGVSSWRSPNQIGRGLRLEGPEKQTGGKINSAQRTPEMKHQPKGSCSGSFEVDSLAIQNKGWPKEFTIKVTPLKGGLPGEPTKQRHTHLDCPVFFCPPTLPFFRGVGQFLNGRNESH